MLLAAITGWDLLVGVIVFFTVCAIGVAVAGVFAIREAEEVEDFDPYLERVGQARTVECVCGRVLAGDTREHHLVAEAFTDDALLAGAPVMGGTAMAADFCPAHCPGGCNQGCPILRTVT